MNWEGLINEAKRYPSLMGEIEGYYAKAQRRLNVFKKEEFTEEYSRPSKTRFIQAIIQEVAKHYEMAPMALTNKSQYSLTVAIRDCIVKKTRMEYGYTHGHIADLLGRTSAFVYEAEDRYIRMIETKEKIYTDADLVVDIAIRNNKHYLKKNII